MRKRPGLVMLWALAAVAGCGAPPPPDRATASLDGEPVVVPDLPRPVANNAVASLEIGGRAVALSFLGLDATKRPDGITRAGFRWNEGDAAWRPIGPAPGPPRLAATAEAVAGRVYLIGGYTVAEDGSERSVPDVVVYDPAADAWSPAAPMPVPVDDAVSGVWRDSLIYLVSGWHDSDNEPNVQVYDPAADEWTQATPIPGRPVFGHTGGIVGNSIVYVDGVRVGRDPRAFVLERSSWLGEIDPVDPASISWTRLPDHPGPGVYRGAAIGFGDRVVFVGGSDNPYNYDGVGYDGNPSEPTGVAFAWDIDAARWIQLTPPPVATMDHRGLVSIDGRQFTIGGMTAGQRVTAAVVEVPAGTP